MAPGKELIVIVPQVAERNILIYISLQHKTFALSLAWYLKRVSNKIKDHPDSNPADDEIILVVKVPGLKDFQHQLDINVNLIRRYLAGLLEELVLIDKAVQENNFLKVIPIDNPLAHKTEAKLDILN